MRQETRAQDFLGARTAHSRARKEEARLRRGRLTGLPRKAAREERSILTSCGGAVSVLMLANNFGKEGTISQPINTVQNFFKKNGLGDFL